MNAVAETKIEDTRTEEERAAQKKAVADIKQRLKDLAKWQVRNKLVLKEHQRNRATQEGYYDINGKSTTRYSKEYWEQYITALHIIHNRIRKRPDHTKDDEAYLSGDDPALHYAYSIYPDLVRQFCTKNGVEMGGE